MAFYASSDDSRRRAMFANMKQHIRSAGSRVGERASTARHYVSNIPGATVSVASRQKDRALEYVAGSDPGVGANWVADQVSLMVEAALKANLDKLYQAAEDNVAGHTVAMQDRMRKSLQGRIATGQKIIVGNRIDPNTGLPWTPSINVFITKETLRDTRPKTSTGKLRLRTGFGSTPLAANLDRTLRALKESGVSDEVASRMAEHLTLGNSILENQKMRKIGRAHV